MAAELTGYRTVAGPVSAEHSLKVTEAWQLWPGLVGLTEDGFQHRLRRKRSQYILSTISVEKNNHNHTISARTDSIIHVYVVYEK